MDDARAADPPGHRPRGRRRGGGTGLAGVAALLLAAGCTGTTPVDGERDGSPTPMPGPSPTTSSEAEPTPGADPAPTAESAERQPLVLAVNARRPPIDVPERTARRILRGGVEDWRALGEPAAPLRVTRRRAAAENPPYDTVVVVPASAVGPGARTVDVGGVDAMRRPDAYPLTAPARAEPGRVTTVTVVGDVMLGRGVAERARARGDLSHALRPMQDRLAAADLTIGNQEFTLSDDGAPTQGGDSFAADPRVRVGLRDAGFDVIGLANNHLWDFGDRALVDTVRLLREGGFTTFGAGRDARRAREPAIVERNGLRIGVVGFNAIGETPQAGPGRPGAVSVSMPPRTGPLDEAQLRQFLGDVRRLGRRVDLVLAMPHWGTQYTARPEPVQVEVAERIVEAGADVVVGGHPHWVQGASIVDDSLVVQSLGNFVFDMDFSAETMEGLVLELVLWGDEVKQAEFVPYRMDADFAPRVVPRSQAQRLFANFHAHGNRGR